MNLTHLLLIHDCERYIPWKESTIAYFRILFQNFSGPAVKSHGIVKKVLVTEVLLINPVLNNFIIYII
jgi:hypothetical protein